MRAIFNEFFGFLDFSTLNFSMFLKLFLKLLRAEGSAPTSLTGYLPGFFFWVVSLLAKTKYLFHLIPKQRTSHQKIFWCIRFATTFSSSESAARVIHKPTAARQFHTWGPRDTSDDLQTISKLRDPPRQEILSAPSKIFIREKSQSVAQISLIFALWNTNYLKSCTINFEMHKSTKIQLALDHD